MNPVPHSDASILVVDNEEPNVVLLRRILAQAGYTRCEALTDPRRFWDVHTSCDPDIVLLDLHMPYVDGFQLLEGLAAQATDDDYRPVLVLTADITAETRQRALSLGARDFLTKPFDATEVLLRVGNLLQTRGLTMRLREHNATLEERVRERTRALEASQIETVERLALTAEYRDDETGAHIRSVGNLSALLASQLDLAPNLADLIRLAAPLHDIGKIGIPDGILMKPSSLSDEEMRVMRTHPTLGAEILGGTLTPLLEVARQIALTHHERWDGTGYPTGLSGESIPLPGRITAVADVFDALTHARRYKAAWPVDEAIDEIVRGAGTQFDPLVVEAFLVVIERDGVLPARTEAATAAG